MKELCLLPRGLELISQNNKFIILVICLGIYFTICIIYITRTIHVKLYKNAIRSLSRLDRCSGRDLVKVGRRSSHGGDHQLPVTT